MRAGRNWWAVGGEQVKVFDLHHFAEARLQMPGRPGGNLTPAIFEALFTGDGCADDVHQLFDQVDGAQGVGSEAHCNQARVLLHGGGKIIWVQCSIFNN
ncbi:MAG: hypothetical protein MUC85_00870 [Anaerolineales bacterium]|nr:hypothetical protein [Anaerolineales bacterium]